MKQFLKFTMASCLGMFLAMVILFLFFAGYIGSLAGKKPVMPKKTVLELDFSSFIPEKTGNVSTDPFTLKGEENIGLNSIVALLDHAKTDDKVHGILIKGSGVGGGAATSATIREALLDFKESEKFVYAYADFYSQSGYYLSSVADSVFMNPNGSIDIKGYATFMPFFKKAMDKIGVSMNIFYAGNFKSATEPFRREDMSEPSKIQTREFLESMVDQYKEVVAKSRNLSVEDMDQIMTEYLGKNAESSLNSGLIDQIVYWDEVEAVIRGKLDIKDTKKIRFRSLADYKASVKFEDESDAKDQIAVVYAEGTVTYGSDSKGTICEDKYLKILDKIRKDDDIKAVVLRVNSGGGSSITSDIIWRGLERVKEAGKPVVASFGDYAASGGYYIAAGADSIVSAPNCLTGSIGVFMMFPNLSELANEKLGINFDEVKTHPMAVGITPMKELTDQEKELLQEGTIEVYETFLKRVASGRGMTRDEVHEVAQGRVWTGTKAKELGLVDVIGGIDDAIRIAGEMAGIEEYKMKTYPSVKETFMEQVLKGIAQSDKASAVLGIEMDETDFTLLREYKEVKNLLLDRTPQARLPFILSID